MRLLRILKNDCQRAFGSKAFLLCTLAVPVFILVTVGQEITFLENNSLLFTLDDVLYFKGLGILLVQIIPLFPFSLAFARDWQDGATRYSIIRSGPTPYILSKFLVSMISAFSSLLLGIMLSVPLLKAFFPQLSYIPEYMEFDIFYNQLVMGGHPFLGYLSYSVHYALAACICAACAVWFSTYVPNPFAVIAAPMAIFFFIGRFTFLITIPRIIDPDFWLLAAYTGNYPFLHRIGVVVVLCGLMCFGTIRQMKRRVLYG